MVVRLRRPVADISSGRHPFNNVAGARLTVFWIILFSRPFFVIGKVFILFLDPPRLHDLEEGLCEEHHGQPEQGDMKK